jgi:hypothetical protein
MSPSPASPPGPHRVGPLAWVDLTPKWQRCLAWLIRRLESDGVISARALAREMRIRWASAQNFISSDWKVWAEKQLEAGRTPDEMQAPKEQLFRELGSKLRDAPGTHLRDAPATDSNLQDKQRIAGS